MYGAGENLASEDKLSIVSKELCCRLAFVLLALLPAGCTAAAPAEPTGSSQSTLLPAELEVDARGNRPTFTFGELPAGFSRDARILCRSDDVNSLAIFYFTDAPVETEIFVGTRKIIFSATPANVRELEQIVADTGDPGSGRPSEVGIEPSTAFDFTVAEPIAHPWPAVAWTLADFHISLIGLGLDDDELQRTAEAIQYDPEAEFPEPSELSSQLCR